MIKFIKLKGSEELINLNAVESIIITTDSACTQFYIHIFTTSKKSYISSAYDNSEEAEGYVAGIISD